MDQIKNSVLICPRNDEESLMILKIAEKINLPTVVSKQPHGAKLSREKKLVERIRKASPDAKQLIIVELPGPDTEQDLKDEGFEITIIDHHRYDDLDRMQKKSSLEQFLDHLKITDDQLKDLGFDPLMVSSVAALDRGFIWELKDQNLSKKDFKRALKFYRDLTLELGEERREREEEEARRAWDDREERDGIIFVQSDKDDLSIRDAISFIVAEEFSKPQPVLIIQGERRMYVQDCDRALDLYDKFGGFTFGQDKCWGILSEDKNLPSVDEVLAVIVK